MTRFHPVFGLVPILISLSCARGVVVPGGKSDGSSCGNLQSDPSNCGTCGKTCTTQDEGSCRAGVCRCQRNTDCDFPEACRDGACLPPDRSGPKCVDDSDCARGDYCVDAHCTKRLRLPEICDGHDNDGDGSTDEPDETAVQCYTGPPRTVGVGVCQAGMRLCLDGRYGPCLMEIAPRPEKGRFACDDRDDNCDGCVDGNGGGTAGCEKAVPPNIDIVIHIDSSGSMRDKIAAVLAALERYAALFATNIRFRFGLVHFSDKTVMGEVKVLLPLSDFTSFQAALAAITDEGSGNEVSYDSVWLAASGFLDAELMFRPDSYRVYVVMGDETPQTWKSLDEKMVCDAVDKAEVLLIVFNEKSNWSGWDDCASGHLYEISSDADDMTKKLEGALALPCY